MATFMQFIVLIIMIVSLVGVFSGLITFIEFIAAFYGGIFLFLYTRYLEKS